MSALACAGALSWPDALVLSVLAVSAFGWLGLLTWRAMR